MMEWIEIISTVGFPITIVVWFMIRTEKIIQNNTEVMREVLRKL